MDSESLLDAQCRKSPVRNNSGFPITNVGNDRRGSFVGNDTRGSFRMGERDADDVRDENHEATGFFPANSHNSAGPLPVTPVGPPVMPAGPSCHARRPLPVMPAGPPLSFPQFLAGIQS